jgi:flagellar capping protein FliD
MATSAVSSTTTANTAAMSTSTSGTGSTSSASSAQAASKAAAQKLVTSLGSGSGVDVNSLAQNLVDAERIPRQAAIQKKIDKNNSRVSGLSAMMYMLNDLKTKLSALKDKSSLSSMTTTSSSSAVSATAVAGAVVGSHEIQVNRLASAQRVVSAGFASESSSINNGNPFQISISKPGVTTGTAGVSTAVNGQQVVLSGIDLNGASDFSGFSVQVDGQAVSVSPTLGLSSMADLAADLQSRLGARLTAMGLTAAAASLTVTVDPTQPTALRLNAGSGHSVSSPSLTASSHAVHLTGASFSSADPRSDFTQFSLEIGGVPKSVTLNGLSTTPQELATDISAQLNIAGFADVTAEAVGTASNFRLYFKDAQGRSLVNPTLTAAASALADGAAAGTVSHATSGIGAERMAVISGINLSGGSDFGALSLKIDGTLVSATPQRGLTSLADMAADLQTQFRSTTGIADLTVSVDATTSGQINISSASSHTFSNAQLAASPNAVHLDGIQFGTTPATDDFKSFSVVIGGVTRTLTPAPTAATPAGLAADLQAQLRALEGDSDVSVSAQSTASGFSLYLSSASSRSITNPKLQTQVVDMTPPVGLSAGASVNPATGVKTGTSSGATIGGIALGSPASTGNLTSFSVTIDGVVRTVTPSTGGTRLTDLATDLQTQLRSQMGNDDLVVSASGTDTLTFSSKSGKTVSGPILSATSLSGVSFATNNPTTKDFRGFGLTVDGTNFTIAPSPAAATLEALAADLQSQLRTQDGKNDLSVSVANGRLQFSSASGRAISNPLLLPNTYELTPAGVARAINDKKLGLTAQVVNTGSSSNPYKLVISGGTGLAQAFDISSTASSGSVLGFSNLSTAADADFVVDGVAMTRNSNTVSDAITGVTLNLKGTTPGGLTPTPASLDIGLDTSTFKTKMTDLVASFNDTSDLLNQVSDPKSTLDTYGATLVGDSVVRSVKQQMRSLFQGNSSTPGITVSAFWQMGIKVDEKGVMSFDTATFETTVRGNYADVVKSLTGNFDNLSTYSTAPAGFAGDAVRKLTNLLAATGPILSASETANTQNTKYQEDLTRLQTRMDALLVRYQKQLAAMDSLVGSTNSKKTSLKSSFDGMMSVYTNN